MNPSDALTKDWGMYYDGCWMKHRTLGVGRVLVAEKTLYLDRDDAATKVDPEDLSCWWPRPGAFNVGKSAVYIARRTIRNMRKSAVGGDHYYLKWGNPYACNVMETLKKGTNHVPLSLGLQMLDRGDVKAVAVSRDIIIKRESATRYNVIYRGNEVGTWNPVLGFKPLFLGSPFTRRVMRQLEEME